jgi:pilus assembly protein CpaC
MAIGNKSGSLTAYIQAFEKDGVARVLAEPTVTAISGESAKFTAGGTVPIATASSFNTQTGACTVTTTLMPYGVTLNFTPTVLSEGRISLHLATEVTEIDPLTGAPSACSNTLGFTTRKNETTVELPSGGSIMSAGLIQQQNRAVIAGLPGLMNLPVLGALFRSRDYERHESELVVIVTPYIAKTLPPDQIARPDDGLVDASDPQSMFLGRVNQIYSQQPQAQELQKFNAPVGFIQD